MNNQTGISTIDELNGQLQRIRTSISTRKILLHHVRWISSTVSRKSEVGWVLSALTNDLGTLMAVNSGSLEKRWEAVVRSLEHEILMLTVDEKLKEFEIRQKQTTVGTV